MRGVLGIQAFMVADHRTCDELFAALEDAVGRGDFRRAASEFVGFRRAMQRHFWREESILFPRYQAAAGQRGGPVSVMLAEHAQMRDLMAAMETPIRAGHKEKTLGLSETLLVLMQQHNMKEEQILYPMTAAALRDDAQTLIEEMSDANVDEEAEAAGEC